MFMLFKVKDTMAVDNKSLGKFTLAGIAPAPRGVPQIEVAFDLDANGILTVTAVDKGTGKQANITITGSSTLSDEEKEKAIAEAERQKDADLARKSKVEAKNNAENVSFQAEKLVAEMGDKLDADSKANVLKAKAEVDEAVKKADPSKDELDETAKKLQDLLMEIGQKIYSQQAPQEGETPQDNSTQSKDETPAQDVDAKAK